MSASSKVRPWVSLVVSLVALAMLSAGCSIQEDGYDECEGFKTTSKSIDEGESAPIEVLTGNDSWPEIDVGGEIWNTDALLGPSVPSDTLLQGTAILLDVEKNGGRVVDGTVRVDFGEFGIVEFQGPIFCE